MTSDDRVHFYDCTLRDGQQTQGVDFSVADKRTLSLALDELGIDYVEGGWPGANPTDDAFFEAPPRLTNAKMVAFGMTRRIGRSADNDPGMAALLNSRADGLTIVGKTWDYHVDLALGADRDEYLEVIADSVRVARARKGEAIFDAEHFFDGYKANPDYALSCLDAAYQAGARWIVLCDTNGGTLPGEVSRIVGEVAQRIPGRQLGIHTHDDTGNAVANSLAAVEAGVRQVQGTLNGLGERCGNANLISVIASIALKTDFKTRITDVQLKELTPVSRLLDERLNRAPSRGAPYVGESAFAHKGGLHVSAVEKDPKTYEHIEPGLVGNRRHIVVSDQSGRSNILARFREIGIEMDPNDPAVADLVERVKAREFEGYAYDGAEASFELLARRALKQIPDYFALSRFRVMDDRRWNARGELVTESEATVTTEVAGREMMTVANGNGPVNALDKALRKALLEFYPQLEDMRLSDYKVRILTPQAGTGAVTRVMIESADGQGRSWTTVGVSTNIIDASFNALHDGLTWKLYQEGAAEADGPRRPHALEE
jgi:2-isopropylmalate synthase